MHDSSPDSPAVRASDQEREAAAERLRVATAEGRLTLDELAERLEGALAARTRDELEPLTTAGRWRIAPRSTVVNVRGGAATT